jgi:presenilin-like A22 family membrane protease
MKHNTKITLLLLGMFFLTQLIALYIAGFYLDNHQIPFGFDQSRNASQEPNFAISFLTSFISSFIIAILIIFFLMKIKSAWFMRIWFFLVVIFAIAITLNVFFIQANLPYPSILGLIVGTILSYFKTFKRNTIVHNLSELLIYPGIAAIFVSILNLPITIFILIAISIYDIWAVWHSGVMQKMAKYQINKVGVFAGFLIPYANKKVKEKIKALKLKYNNKIPMKIIKNSKIKINIAMLGGGDIAFSAIASGIFLKTTSSIYGALIVTLFTTLALAYLFVFSEKKKFYPAMPYLTTGIFIGMLVAWLLLKFL